MSIIAELKRRNVFRVAALYLVAAWVLLQVGELLFGLLDLPGWTNKLLFAALVLGFVPALIFSWTNVLRRSVESETHSGRSPIMATTGIAPLQSIESAMTTH